MLIDDISDFLISDFNPSFLAFDTVDEGINVIISSDCFLNQSMPERIRSVFRSFEKNAPNILENNPIFVQAFTSEELDDVFRLALGEGF